MLVRSKSQTGIIRRGRLARGAHRSSTAVSEPGSGLQTTTGTSRSRRHGGPSEDRALYTCHCGYAFDALVSTSVDCPKCGRTQAW